MGGREPMGGNLYLLAPLVRGLKCID